MIQGQEKREDWRRQPTKPASWGLSAFCFVIACIIATDAHASFTICAVGSIRTTDSGRSIPAGPNTGDTEDYWPNADNTISKSIPGIWIGVYRPGSGNTYEHAGSDRCADFSISAASNSSVTFYSNTSLLGQGLMLHNAPYDFSLPVGSTWSYKWTSQNLQDNHTYTYTGIGSNIAKWTALFTANFTLRAWDQALDDVLPFGYIYLGADESCTSSTRNFASAHYGNSGADRSNGQITSGRHFLAIANCTTGAQVSRQKSIVSHEVGHAIAALYYGTYSGATNGDEPNSDDYTKDSADGETNACSDGLSPPGYFITSKEWNSVAFREGMAHFIAASSWNDKDDGGVAGQNGDGTGQEGEFTWFQTPEDLERYNQGGGTLTGGHLENEV